MTVQRHDYRPSTSSLLLSLLLCTALLSPITARRHLQSVTNSTLEQTQRTILTKFYSGTNGPNWSNDKNWLSDDVPVCSWYGIKCNAAGEVTSIDLEDNQLDGTTPADLFDLSSLLLLNLRLNPVDVSMEQIGNAANLHTLILSDANVWKLEGIGSAPALKSLHLTNNAITGTVPEEIYQLTTLEELYLNYNNFTGSVSSNIGRLKNLELLYFYQNALSGEIHTEI